MLNDSEGLSVIVDRIFCISPGFCSEQNNDQKIQKFAIGLDMKFGRGAALILKDTCRNHHCLVKI